MINSRPFLYVVIVILTGCGEKPPAAPRYIKSLEIINPPAKTNYRMGEPLDFSGLKLRQVYSDGSVEATEDYKIYQGDTYTAGRTQIVLTSDRVADWVSYTIQVEDTLADTGIPVIYINTQNSEPVTSKEVYIKTNVRIASDHPEYVLNRSGFKDEIRGRGNSTWDNPKKPYRLKFEKKTSLFGLTAAKSWVLLADYRSPVLLQNTIGFELGRRFGLPFTHQYKHVEVVLNDRYIGTYILTEQVQTGEGRVNIDEENGFLVELDFRYDEDVQFRTDFYKLPVMVKSPEDITPEKLNAIREIFNALEVAVNNHSYEDILDVDNVIDYLLINDVIMNFELQVPASIYMYRNGAGKIRMGPLWDFDCGYGYEDDGKTFYRDFSGRIPHLKRRSGSGAQQFLIRLFEDPKFIKRYREKWNERYASMKTIPSYIDSMFTVLEKSRELNYRRWYTDSRNKESGPLKIWWNNRLNHLNDVINRN